MFYREDFRIYQTSVSKSSFQKLLKNISNLFILGSQEFLRLITHYFERDKTKGRFQGWVGH